MVPGSSQATSVVRMETRLSCLVFTRELDPLADVYLLFDLFLIELGVTWWASLSPIHEARRY